MLPLTADDVLQLARSFMEARILLTATELDLFTLLADQPLSSPQAAARLNADARSLAILLDALTALGLLTKRDAAYHCPPELAKHLAANAPASIVPMLRHQAGLWRRWARLTDIVRGTGLPAGDRRGPEDTEAFIGAMEVVSGPLAPALAAAIQPGGARALLDVGGGPGTYTVALLRAAPQMRATLFDQPAVIEMARPRLARAGALERVTLAAGDFYTDELPTGHDLALLSAIIHQNSPQQNIDLYRKVWRALQPGGRIVIRDHVLHPDRTQPRAAAVFAVNMLVGTEGGNCYTFEDMRAGLMKAGFERVRLMQESDQMAGLVEAFKPAG